MPAIGGPDGVLQESRPRKVRVALMGKFAFPIDVKLSPAPDSNPQ